MKVWQKFNKKFFSFFAVLFEELFYKRGLLLKNRAGALMNSIGPRQFCSVFMFVS